MRLPGIVEDTGGVNSDDWWTPLHIIDALGLTYDLDPCAPPGGVPWIPAAKVFAEADDGLTQPWFGRVWLNPPYSDPGPWLYKLMEHDNGIALIPADTSTKTWHTVAPTADAVCFIRSRIRFVQVGNTQIVNARFASALLAWDDICANAVRNSGLGWVP